VIPVVTEKGRIVNDDSSEEKLLRDILNIEEHEDRMITLMVHLMASSERLNRRLGVLTWIMLILTWITFVIAIPNTLATIFGIPRVSQIIGLEVMVTALIVSTVGALLLLILPGSALSLRAVERSLRKMTVVESELSTSDKLKSARASHPEREKNHS